jgi:hypothetical protein
LPLSNSFFGRSTGAGSIAAWTHNLKSIDVLQWSDASYSGPAIKMGAGVLGYEVADAAKAAGLMVLGGTCPTVGIAGGYTQGGGHSALSTSFGMAADQVLEFDVVTTSGKITKASATENPDLFWALRGGGPGTYAIVTAVTVRAHPDGVVGGYSLQTAASFTTQEKWWQMLSAFHSLLPSMTDKGATVVYFYSSSVFAITPITAYGQTGDQAKAIAAPFLEVLANLSIPFSAAATTSASYRDHYNTYMGPLPYGHLTVESYQFGSRLIPRATLSSADSLAGFMSAARFGADNGVLAAGVALNATAPAGVTNAVHPAWRQATVHLQLTKAWSNDPSKWSAMMSDQALMTDQIVPKFEAATPGSGNYVNEADFNMPGWQNKFFGPNYPRLLAVKQKYDPNGVLYGLKTVGSANWNVAADGRMCKTGPLA